jgi:hypothetical protein
VNYRKLVFATDFYVPHPPHALLLLKGLNFMFDADWIVCCSFQDVLDQGYVQRLGYGLSLQVISCAIFVAFMYMTLG